MLELASASGEWQLGYGGDTLNTAIHLARAEIDTAFLTALGSDPFSADLRDKWRAEGLDTGLVLDHPARTAGLYAITTDPQGERSFTYWRDNSAARAMFECPGIDSALSRAESAELLVFSLITLAILPPEGRERLLDLARRFRERGGRVAFDGNYRPRLWTSLQEAQAARDAAIGCATIGLPTLEDEVAMTGAQSAAQVAEHWQGLGCAETVIKLGAEGCLLPGGQLITPAQVLAPLDTSGAGDAFNAGYLAARLRGADLAQSARAGHELAGWTIMRPGAIPVRD